MLDQLRKHASSWMIKAVLTLIILTFIFFFGYSRVASRYQNSERNVAQVENTEISRRKFEMMFQSSMDKMRENFKGEVPPQISDLLRKNVLDQMVTREVIVKLAGELGLTVSDEELATEIRSNKNLFPDSPFDTDVYQKQFLPNYRQKYGEDYETTVRRDLLVEKTQLLIITLFSPWQTELEASLEEIKAKKKTAKAETKPTKAETQPLEVESMSPFDLFTTWLNAFKEGLKIEVFERAS